MLEERETKRRLLGGLKDEARNWKREALLKKYGPKEEAPAEDAGAELADAADEGAGLEGEAPVEDSKLEEAKALLAELPPEALQELLSTLKR